MIEAHTVSHLERKFQGIGASPGIITGKVFVYGRDEVAVVQKEIRGEDVGSEIGRFEQALLLTRQQLQEIQKRIIEDLGENDGAIFDAHLLVLDDPSLIDEVVRRIQEEHQNVEFAFENVSTQYFKSLLNIEDAYLRERAADIKDVAHRVLRNLEGQSSQDLRTLVEPCIVLAYDLSPSDTATLDRAKVLGFCTDIGSRTSHTAIMARAMDIPAVVGLHDSSHQIESGCFALLDGYGGWLYINPSEQTLYDYGQLEHKRHTIEVSLESLRDLPSETTDHVRVMLGANIEMPSDVPHVLENGADGVGLFRTEYIFINRKDMPTEDEQYRAYAEVAEKMNPKPVIIRTLDLGGDKFLSHLEVAREMNPFLGWRAIRFCLERTDIFQDQLRAILRASRLGNVQIMYPMISGVGELRRANAELDKARQTLRERGIAFDEKIKVGCMIEIPSAALTADLLAKETNFFSVGTNDLIQYSLAVDRVNEKIAHLYEPTHPAIIRSLKNIADAAHKAGIPAGICGEMAGDVTMAPLLVGMGFDELSTSPSVVPQLKKLVRSMSKAQANEVVHQALELSTGDEIRKLSVNLAKSIAPDIMELSAN
ncbi:MAG: phosphoenolpyruvate--protein phosphotransferase [Verrucomicrobiae bacterium]|nr:phosphoenolpyruvate--protein phosphotransferase [Verrucomicrobiae bacterium]